MAASTPYIDPERPEAAEARKRVSRLVSAALLGLRRKIGLQIARIFRDLHKADEPTVEDLMELLSIEFDDDLEDDLIDEFGRIYSSSGQAALSQVGVATADDLVNRVNNRAITWAERHAADLVGVSLEGDNMLAAATRSMLRTTIVEAMRENLSAEDVAARIEEQYAFSAERAELIAMTEIATANSMGALDGYKEAEDLGVGVGKSWLILDDACGVCHSNEEAGIIPLDDTFPSGDLTPPGHPNCRCVIVPHTGFVKMEKAIRLSGWDETKHPRDKEGKFSEVAHELGGYPNPMNDREFVTGTRENVGGVTIRDNPEGGWHLTDLRAITRGGGRVAMERVTALADKYGKEIDLFPVPLESPAGKKMSVAKLKQWYAQFGFVVQGGTMVRAPKAEKLAKLWDEAKHPRDRAGQFTFARTSNAQYEMWGNGRVFTTLKLPSGDSEWTWDLFEVKGDEIDLQMGSGTTENIGQFRTADAAIREARAYINGAKKWDEAEHPRNPAGSPEGGRFASVSTYIGDDPYSNSVGINGKLREGKELTDNEKRVLADVEAEIQENGHTVGAVEVVYRGSLTPLDEHSPHPISTTVSRHVAAEFAGQGEKGHIYRVVLTRGTKFLPIHPYQQEGMQYQKEFMLPRGRLVPQREPKHWDQELNHWIQRVEFIPDPEPFTKAAWDETKHPRHPAGGSDGGEFASVAEFKALPSQTVVPEKGYRAQKGRVDTPLQYDPNLMLDSDVIGQQIKVQNLENGITVSTEEVPLASIVTWQSTVNRNKVLSIMDNGLSDPDVDNPLVASYRGKLILMDGNHRLAAEILKGKSTVSVDVMDSDAYFAQHPGREEKWREWGRATPLGKAAWDETKHPRHPAGGPQGGEFSGTKNDAHAAIDQEVSNWALLGVNQPGKKWLLENGEECGPVIDLPDGMKLGTQKMCYMNSYQAILHGMVDRDEWFYTEGVTTLPGLPLTIDHAWLTNRKGEVLDLTLRDNTGHTYFGIPFGFDYVSKRVLKTGHYGLFSNGVHWHPEVIDEPVGNQRAWPKRS